MLNTSNVQNDSCFSVAGNIRCSCKPPVLTSRGLVAVFLEIFCWSDVSIVCLRWGVGQFYWRKQSKMYWPHWRWNRLFQEWKWTSTSQGEVSHNVQVGISADVRAPVWLQLLPGAGWGAHSRCSQAYSKWVLQVSCLPFKKKKKRKLICSWDS